MIFECLRSVISNQENPVYFEASYAGTFVASFARLDRFMITHYESSGNILGKSILCVPSGSIYLEWEDACRTAGSRLKGPEWER